MKGDKDGRLLGLRAWLLLLIEAGTAHGYGLERRLEDLGVAHDDSSIYRSLREMAGEGVVSSWWEESHTAGPVRRSYRLTDTGQELLDAWRREADLFARLSTSARAPMAAGGSR